MHAEPVHLYFHSPCFDGIVSAALASDYLENVRHYPQTLLYPVNYHLREKWLHTPLAQPAAVVDFLYHPDAAFWADHHGSAFVEDAARSDYERRRSPEVLYDEGGPSCSLLLWQNWGPLLPSPAPHYEELVHWANRMDSADYTSVHETESFEAPALQISLALGMYPGDAFSHHLVWMFRTHSLAAVAARPEVRTAFARGRELRRLGLERIAQSARLTDNGIVVFDVNTDGVLVNRYAPFIFFPDARYSAGITRTAGKAKITAMRNPWLDFPGVPLGSLATPLGGGGHHRVASILVKPDQHATALLHQLLASIQLHESATPAPAFV